MTSSRRKELLDVIFRQVNDVDASVPASGEIEAFGVHMTADRGRWHRQYGIWSPRQ